MMDTTSIVLEQVTLEQFRLLEKFWGDNRIARKDQIYARVQNPITAEYYEDLFRDLLRTPGVDRLSLLHKSQWLRCFTKNGFDPERVREMARIARADGRKINFLEVSLYKKGHRLAPPVIEFSEHEGRIVGYKVRVPGNQRELFTIRADGTFDYVNGVWVPNNYAAQVLQTASAKAL